MWPKCCRAITWERGHSLASMLWLASLRSSLSASLTVLRVHCFDGSSSNCAKLHRWKKELKEAVYWSNQPPPPKISCYKHKHSIFTGYLSNWNMAFSATQSLPPVQASSYWKRKVPGTFSKLNIAKPCIHNTRGFWGIAWTQKKWSQL